eukprot:COSAG06_NODE_3290_length_5549_cov_287.338165_2_plen_60_part_00
MIKASMIKASMIKASMIMIGEIESQSKISKIRGKVAASHERSRQLIRKQSCVKGCYAAK